MYSPLELAIRSSSRRDDHRVWSPRPGPAQSWAAWWYWTAGHPGGVTRHQHHNQRRTARDRGSEILGRGRQHAHGRGTRATVVRETNDERPVTFSCGNSGSSTAVEWLQRHGWWRGSEL